VGGLWAIRSMGTFPSGGFEWSNGTFTIVNLGNAGCTNCTSLNGISNAGNMSGEAFRFDFWVGVFKQSKDNDFFKFQGGDTRFTGVNDKADILGFGAGAMHGFWAKNIETNEGTADATETEPSYMLLNFPATGVIDTIPFGINDVRGIVGTYSDSTGQHGFLAKSEIL